MSKLTRAVLYRDSGPELSLRRSQQLEHRAYLLLLAARAGVPVNDVVLASAAGSHDDALLVLRDPPGTPMGAVGAAAITDAVLHDAWANVTRLHHARVTHAQLTGQNVLVRADGTTAFVTSGSGRRRRGPSASHATAWSCSSRRHSESASSARPRRRCAGSGTSGSSSCCR